jgi:DnaJ-class molecular chaperone
VQWVLDTLREREAVCRACGGSGHRNGSLRAADPFGTCPGCGGTGNVAAADREAPDEPQPAWITRYYGKEN